MNTESLPPNNSAPLAIGIDIGGTKIAAGVVDAEGNVLSTRYRSTPGKDTNAVERSLVELVNELAALHPVEAIGVGAAGWMDLSGSTVLFSPHLAWRHEPIRERMQSQLGRPVLILNDADAAAWAEYKFGAGRGETELIMLTLGTGIGGALVHHGEVQRGKFGVAGEFGHQIIMPGGHLCECGNRGCWEQYASGNALGRAGRELSEADSPLAYALTQAAGNDRRAITGALVTELALSGEQTCRDLIQDIGEWLGIGIANLAAALDPGRFVIGGGLSAAGEFLLEPARRTFARNLTGRGFRPVADIVLAQLGSQAGLIGAADLARQEHLRTQSPESAQPLGRA